MHPHWSECSIGKTISWDDDQKTTYLNRLAVILIRPTTEVTEVSDNSSNVYRARLTEVLP